MELVDTKYDAVLQGQGIRFSQIVNSNIKATTIKEDEEMWAILHNNNCCIKIFKKGKDEELYKLGYYKVIKLDKINIYEERSNIF